VGKELRIEKHGYYIYHHKNHIEKVMTVAITAYAIDESWNKGVTDQRLEFIKYRTLGL
jgi:hypothetical protein